MQAQTYGDYNINQTGTFTLRVSRVHLWSQLSYKIESGNCSREKPTYL